MANGNSPFAIPYPFTEREPQHGQVVSTMGTNTKQGEFFLFVWTNKIW